MSTEVTGARAPMFRDQLGDTWLQVDDQMIHLYYPNGAPVSPRWVESADSVRETYGPLVPVEADSNPAPAPAPVLADQRGVKWRPTGSFRETAEGVEPLYVLATVSGRVPLVAQSTRSELEAAGLSLTPVADSAVAA